MEKVEKQNIADYTTFKLSKDVLFTSVNSIQDIEQYIDYANSNSLPFFILGGGSNTIATDTKDNTLVIKNKILGVETVPQKDGKIHIRIGAGEDWDALVRYCVDHNYSGIEALAKIPGTVGAAPVQNIGAYGTELDEVFIEAKVFDTKDMTWHNFTKKDCKFAYRTSIFKKNPGRYVIAEIILELNLLSNNSSIKLPDYPSFKEYWKKHNLKPTLKNIYTTISKIRSSKLPDPKKIPNVGSFFANPIISKKHLEDLLFRFPDLPNFPIKNQDNKPGQDVKIPAGWLIEQAGFKGKEINNIGVYKNNALVLTNPKSRASYDDLRRTTSEIRNEIKKIFNIELEQEPIELA